jgi:hypothetical protein
MSGATEPERVYGRLCRAVDARDWAAVADCFAQDYHAVDHRLLGWEPMGREGVVDVYRSWAAAVPDMQVAFERLAGDEDHMAMLWSGRGRAAADMGGGAAEVGLILVATVRHGRIAFTERFDVDDEGAALARLADRQRKAPDPSDDASPNEGSAAPS